MGRLLDALKRRCPQGVRNQLRPCTYAALRAAVTARRLLGHRGSFPDFIIIGVQKGGTTTLYDALIQHPDVVSARTKEISFFDRYWKKGLDWYLANFPRLDPDSGLITGEATPDYLFSENVGQRIKGSAPGPVKFIVLLRNPVDRAISHYFHERRLGSETEEIETAFELEEERLEKDPDGRVGPRLENLTNRFCFGYVARSRYAEQLREWFELFGREAFYVETSERFFAESNEVRGEILEFLGRSPADLPTIQPRNVGSYVSRVPESIYGQLEEKLRPSVEELEALLDRRELWPVRREATAEA